MNREKTTDIVKITQDKVIIIRFTNEIWIIENIENIEEIKQYFRKIFKKENRIIKDGENEMIFWHYKNEEIVNDKLDYLSKNWIYLSVENDEIEIIKTGNYKLKENDNEN